MTKVWKILPSVRGTCPLLLRTLSLTVRLVSSTVASKLEEHLGKVGDKRHTSVYSASALWSLLENVYSLWSCTNVRALWKLTPGMDVIAGIFFATLCDCNLGGSQQCQVLPFIPSSSGLREQNSSAGLRLENCYQAPPVCWRSTCSWFNFWLHFNGGSLFSLGDDLHSDRSLSKKGGLLLRNGKVTQIM